MGPIYEEAWVPFTRRLGSHLRGGLGPIYEEAWDPFTRRLLRYMKDSHRCVHIDYIRGGAYRIFEVEQQLERL